MGSGDRTESRRLRDVSIAIEEMTARNGDVVNERMRAGRVAVAGLGGLGSNVAVMLARLGVGTLFLVDYDMVEMSNLNRQHYTLKHLGRRKTEAAKSQIAEINPYVEVLTRDIKITAENAAEIFAGYPIAVEAFDDPACKAGFIGALLGAGGVKIVAASGMAGLGSANDIKTARRLGSLYLCGDFESQPGDEGIGLLAPRVIACAAHQANMVARLLMGLDEA